MCSLNAATSLSDVFLTTYTAPKLLLMRDLMSPHQLIATVCVCHQSLYDVNGG